MRTLLSTVLRGLRSRLLLSLGSIVLTALAVGSAVLGPAFQGAVTSSFLVTRLGEAPANLTGLSWRWTQPVGTGSDVDATIERAVSAAEQVTDAAGPGARSYLPPQVFLRSNPSPGLGGVAAHAFTRDDRDGPGYFNYINLLNNYSALTAACIMVRTKVYDQVRGFSEEFVVEYNDVDFCLKVLEAGYRNLYVPHVELFHYESISRGHPHATSESYKRHVKEVNRFRKKWMKYVEHDPCYNPNLTLGAENFAIRI